MKDASVPVSFARRASFVLLFVLAVVTVWSFAWPVYRAFLNIEIDVNEGWNAYLAEAAFGRGPLYPPLDQLVTNNYPPLSFYIVGAVGRTLGDSLLAGRLVSLASVLAIAWGVALCIHRMGASRFAGGVERVFSSQRYRVSAPVTSAWTIRNFWRMRL